MRHMRFYTNFMCCLAIRFFRFNVPFVLNSFESNINSFNFMLLVPLLTFLFALKMPSDDLFVNVSETGEIPSFNGDAKAKATDFANYFCSYAQLYHQKQMLVDHNRMAAYHSAIMGNAEVFKDKVSPLCCSLQVLPSLLS